MHCEWVINRPKAGCKFSTIRFVLLLHCCLLIVRVLVTFIPNSLFFLFLLFQQYIRQIFSIKRTRFSNYFFPFFVFEYVWLALWLWKQQSKKWNGFDANEGRDLMDATTRTAHSLFIVIYLFWFSYSTKCLCVWGVGGARGIEMKLVHMKMSAVEILPLLEEYRLSITYFCIVIADVILCSVIAHGINDSLFHLLKC